jgi:hypothetical protein
MTSTKVGLSFWKNILSNGIMANASAKKSKAMFRKSLLQYGGLAALLNLLFFFTRFWVLALPLSSREWFLLAFTEATLLLSGWSLVMTATDLGTLAASSLDFYGIACATLVLASFWGKGWWILVGVPSYLVYQYGGMLQNLLGLNKKSGGGGDGDNSGNVTQADSKRASMGNGRKATARK